MPVNSSTQLFLVPLLSGRSTEHLHYSALCDVLKGADVTAPAPPPTPLSPPQPGLPPASPSPSKHAQFSLSRRVKAAVCGTQRQLQVLLFKVSTAQCLVQVGFLLYIYIYINKSKAMT